MVCLHFIHYLDMFIDTPYIIALLKKNTFVPELFSCWNSVCKYVLISNNSIFTEPFTRNSNRYLQGVSKKGLNMFNGALMDDIFYK